VTETHPAQDTPARLLRHPLLLRHLPGCGGFGHSGGGSITAPVSVAQIDSGGTYLQVTAAAESGCGQSG